MPVLVSKGSTPATYLCRVFPAPTNLHTYSVHTHHIIGGLDCLLGDYATYAQLSAALSVSEYDSKRGICNAQLHRLVHFI